MEVEHRPAASSGPRLPREERFDYFAVIPAAGGELDWQARSREEGGPSANERRLVGKSPHVRIESAGALKGGGPLSALCSDQQAGGAREPCRSDGFAIGRTRLPVPSRFISIRAWLGAFCVRGHPQPHAFATRWTRLVRDSREWAPLSLSVR